MGDGETSLYVIRTKPEGNPLICSAVAFGTDSNETF